MRKLHLFAAQFRAPGGMPTPPFAWACERPSGITCPGNKRPGHATHRAPWAGVLHLFAVLALAAAWLMPGVAMAGGQAPPPEVKVREIFVPFDDLHVLLESGPQRVLLSREEFEALQAKARKTAENRAPREALLASADYAITAAQERAEIVGTFVVTVLEDGLCAVGLDVGGVGLRSATLDDKGAPLGLADDGRLTLFVQGKGQHKLVLTMVAPLQTTAATQVLNFRVPMPAAARMTLTIPGDVEVKSGAPVVSRVFDDKAALTRIELLPQRGDVSIVMSLNSHLKRQDRVVVARSVLIDEVTQAYERLHVTMSLSVLHRAMDKFRFALPKGFEVTTVESPGLAQWRISAEAGGARILEVQLREETTDKVVLTISAYRTAPNLASWSLPQLEPLDVAGYVAVVGLVVEDRLKAEAIEPEGLIPIDTAVLAQALPTTVLAAEAGAVRIRPVVAYYAPEAKFGLAARFVKPPAKLMVTTNLLLALTDGGQEIAGAFALRPEEEKLFAFDFTVPAGWDVTDVADDRGAKVAFERYDGADKSGRIHVRLPVGVEAGAEKRILFTAVNVPKDWFGEWRATAVDFPVFAVTEATRDIGAIAVDARDDMTVRPEVLDRLMPVDDTEKAKYGLGVDAGTLAYRYEGAPYKARLAIERTQPRVTAQTYSFFRVERDALVAHYEIVYDISEARARRLSLLLPQDTPAALSIRGLDNVQLKEYTSVLVGEKGHEQRRWTATLADGLKGTVRLAVDFEQRLADREAKDLVLPVIVADGTAYQSGLVAVEGSPELDVQVTAHPRRVDVGELADAEYQPGRRLLGAYGFLGDPAPVKVSVARPKDYTLPLAIMQRAALATVLSADGLTQTAARFLLRTKALFLEVKLPKDSTLWSATLNGEAVKPQREGDSLLISLPVTGDAAGQAGVSAVCDLQVVYETPVGSLGLWQNIDVLAPRLFRHVGPTTAGEEVPVADLQWELYLPTGYKVVHAEGSVVTQELSRPELAVSEVAGVVWEGSGGADFDHSALALVLGIGSMAMYGIGGQSAPMREEATGRKPAGQFAAQEGEKAATDMLTDNEITLNVTRDKDGNPQAVIIGDADGNGDGSNNFWTDFNVAGAKEWGGDRSKDRFTQGHGVDANGKSWAVGGQAGNGVIVNKSGVVRGPVAGKTAEKMVPPQTQPPTVRYSNVRVGPDLPLATTTPASPTSGGNNFGGDTMIVRNAANLAEAGPVVIASGAGSRINVMREPGTPASSTISGTLAALAAATPPPPAETSPAKPARQRAEKDGRGWALEGVSSLKIDLERTGDSVTFRSLGSEPRLGLTVANVRRLDALAAGLALAVFLIGAAMTGQPIGRKVAYIVVVGLVATLVPVITGRIELALVVNGMFYAACLLVPYYLVAGLVRWIARKWCGEPAPVVRAAGTATLILAVGGVLASMLAGAPAAVAAEPPAPYVVQIVPPGPPVKVPDDAVVLPYDPATKVGIPNVDKLLVPYDKFVELWNTAYPEKPIGAKAPPAPYAMAGASLAATLKGDEYLLVEGTIDLDVYTDEYATIPLPLDGGVLAKADLDGKPARLSVAQAGPVAQPPAPQAGKAAAPVPTSFIVLYVSGKGRHRLDIAVRLRLEKRGGWRVAEGRLPAAPATALELRVPDAGTEVRLGGVNDRRSYETKAAAETIRTALGAGGAINLQWRPKVSEGQIDQTLTAESTAELDVQEDQLRLRWSLKFEFRHGEREFFTVEIPPGYLVEKVEGQNVRGWELKPAGARQDLEVTVLKRAKETEQFTITLWRVSQITAAKEFDVPVVGVTGAVRHSGRLTIRRSPMLDLRTVSTSGVTRTDFTEPSVAHPPSGGQGNAQPGAAVPQSDSPLGIRPFQAYQFVTVPFEIRLAAEPVASRVSAVVQTILRMAERERRIESRTLITAENRPLYQARFVVPADLKIDSVQAPGAFEWALTEDAGRKILTVYLGTGIQGELSILIQGKLGQDAAAEEMALPRLEVLGVERQEGDIVVQVDPAFEIRADNLKNAERILLARVFGWLSEKQRALAQLALHYTNPDYAGRLALVARKPDVACFTVTNSRVTDRAIQDAILIDWTIKNAGIREVSFLLPVWMKDARINVRLLRQKTVTPVSAEPGAPVRVRLELQDEVMDNLRVLVENDRLLTAGAHEAAIPVVETGRTDRRYVAVESAGRDEVVVTKQDGLEPLSRQQKEWKTVEGMLRGGMTQAFIVSAGAEKPLFEFSTKERAAVETAKGRIGLGQTVLVMDASGAYRAAQVYRLDNRTEQFLEIELPEGASLWTAMVAGEPVKPTVADAAKPRLVRIPIVKTAAGDLDYAVVLKYAGKVPEPGPLSLSVEFPLIRTLNINVELSQVELYLPETDVWGWFRGTLRRVNEEGEFEAGVLAYKNKMAEGLVRTLRFGNPFEKARAAANWKSLSQDIAQSQSDFSKYQANKDVQLQVGNATTILKDADKEIQGQQAQAGDVGTSDNNGALLEAFNQQRNTRAKNLVNDVGGNDWSVETQVTAGAVTGSGGIVTAGVSSTSTAATGPGAAPQRGEGRFNQQWFAANNLENPQVQTEVAGKGEAKKDQINQRLELGTLKYQNAPNATAVQPPAQSDQYKTMQQLNAYSNRGKVGGAQEPLQINAPATVAMPQGEQLGGQVRFRGGIDVNNGTVQLQPQGQMAAQQQEQRRNDTGYVVQKYQQKLEMNAARENQVQVLTDGANAQAVQHWGVLAAGDVSSRRAGSAGQDRQERAGRADLGTISGTSGAVTFYDAAAAAAAPSGMASLDVELPRRGTMYRFTTPRGKVEIKAMAASQPLIEGIERLGAVVALIVLVLVVRRILRRQSMSLRAQNILATVLIILGIVGVTFGLLPVVGVLAVFAGVIMKVRLYRIRRRPAVTA